MSVHVAYDRGEVTYLEEEWFRAARPDHNVPVAMRIEGRFDPRMCGDVVDALVRRHEALRTAFREKAGGVERIVLRRYEAELRVIDVSGGRYPEEEAARLVVAEAERIVDLTEPPLWRGCIVRAAPTRHIVTFCFHHSICDGWASSVFLRDFVALYRAKMAGKVPRLPTLAVKLSEYAEWERSRDLSPGGIEYWRGQLPGRQQRLPFRRGRGDAVAGGRPFPPLSPDALSAVAQTATRTGVSVGDALRAAVLAALAPYLGCGAVVGFAEARRSLETRPIMGAFADFVLVRLDVRDDYSFLDLLSSVHVGLAASRRQAAPVRLIREAVGRGAWGPDEEDMIHVSINYMPQFRLARSWRVSDDPRVDIAAVSVPMTSVRRVAGHGYMAAVPVGYHLLHNPDGGVSGEIWGRAAVSPVAVVERLGREFARTARRVAMHPDATIGRLSQEEF